jgi:hypothetical protein
MSGIASSHHVLGIEHLGSQVSDGSGSEVLGLTGRQGSEANQEEVETREGDQVDGQLAQVRVELSRESEAACDSTHHRGHQVVQISVRGVREFEGSKADIVQGFVINAHHFISVLDKLMHREGSVIWFDDGI